MRLSRIYHDGELAVGETRVLSVFAAQHLVRTLRLKVGSPCILFNGKGGEYTARIVAVEKRQTIVEVVSFEDSDCESPLTLILAQGISRGDKMDFTLQKAVELGVRQIVPVLSERCGVKLSEKRWETKHAHWSTVIISACEQCGRNRLPVLESPRHFQALINTPQSGHKLILDPTSEHRIKDRITTTPSDPITLLVGPEGGFSDHEIAQACEAGFAACHLGPRIVRTETAALAAMAALQGMYGDF